MSNRGFRFLERDGGVPKREVDFRPERGIGVLPRGLIKGIGFGMAMKLEEHGGLVELKEWVLRLELTRLLELEKSLVESSLRVMISTPFGRVTGSTRKGRRAGGHHENQRPPQQRALLDSTATTQSSIGRDIQNERRDQEQPKLLR